jgi:hypothetical protein
MALGLCAVGCKNGPFARRDNIPAGYTPNADQLIAHLNQNAKVVQSVECDRLDITVSQGLKPSVGIDGLLAYQKPRSFRLQAHAMSQTRADVGSNEREFWFWLKDNNPPALFHCSYEDFPQCKNLAIPMHPDWMAEALCVTEFGPANQYQHRTVGNAMELTMQTTTPQGQPVSKTTLVALTGPNNGRIIGMKLRTKDGKEIWSADVGEYQNVNGAWIPKQVTVKSPADRMEMKFRLNACRVNNIVAGRNPELFRKPSGYQEVDLARGPNATPSSVTRVRGASQ